MEFGSLFAGIGGMDLGLERAGMKCKWQVEIDPYCQKVLAKHWPAVERFEDVRKVGKHNLGAVDLVCGGFPCQPVSCAGKQNGEADERWLWPEFARVIREVRPRWVFGENVPGLLSIDAGRTFGTVLRDLAACGYVVEWDCIPAAAVGAPHRRDRVFILAHANDQFELPEKAVRSGRNVAGMCGEFVAHADRESVLEKLDSEQVESGKPTSRRRHVVRRGDETTDSARIAADTSRSRLEIRPRVFENDGTEFSTFVRSDWWATEPAVGRMAHGVPGRMDRLRGLGNAVVPQVAEWIGHKILEANKVVFSGHDRNAGTT